MSFSVSTRRTEVGVRMAMGAEPRGIVRLILLQGSRPLAAGIVVGIGLAVLLGRALESQLFGVTATDPATFGGVPLLLILVSLIALLLPALRASRIAPIVALRDSSG
jgi:ABC-type antimicrobial peptide transport system permease subunit